MNNDLSHSYQFVQYVFLPILILNDNNHHLTNFLEYLDRCFSPRFYGRSMLPSSSNGEKVSFATMQRPFSFCEHLSVKSLQWIVLAIILLLEREKWSTITQTLPPPFSPNQIPGSWKHSGNYTHELSLNTKMITHKKLSRWVQFIYTLSFLLLWRTSMHNAPDVD